MPAWINIKNLVDLLACSVWAIRLATLLCRVIHNPVMCCFAHVQRRWGHVSLSMCVHNIKLRLVCVNGHNMFFFFFFFRWFFVLCVAKWQHCDNFLVIYALWFPEGVQEFVINLLVGEPLVYIWEFVFGHGNLNYTCAHMGL